MKSYSKGDLISDPDQMKNEIYTILTGKVDLIFNQEVYQKLIMVEKLKPSITEIWLIVNQNPLDQVKAEKVTFVNRGQIVGNPGGAEYKLTSFILEE